GKIPLSVACCFLAFSPLLPQQLAAQTAAKKTPVVTGTDTSAAAERAAAAAVKRAKTSYGSAQYKDAEEKLNRMLKQYPKAPAEEEALVMLADISLRLNKEAQ